MHASHFGQSKAGENRHLGAASGPTSGGSDAHGKVAIAKINFT